jgi:hypothetical protein
MGDLFVFDGMDAPVPMGLVAAAEKPPKEITIGGVNRRSPRETAKLPSRYIREHIYHVPR